MAYTTADSLLLGDMQVSSTVDKDAFVNDATDEIDAAIGHLYATPVNMDPDGPVARHSRLLLKRINTLIATGRLVLGLNSGQSEHLHQYGVAMLKEGLGWLQKVVDQEILLAGAPAPDGATDSTPGGPTIINEDELSAVTAFYDFAMRQETAAQGSLVWAPGSVTHG